MVVISVVSAKGGVGKTTLSASLAAGLSRWWDVFAVDLDPQNALRLHLGCGGSALDGVARATLEGRGWRGVAQRTSADRLVVLPYGDINEPDRDAFEVFLSANPNWLASGLDSLGLGSRSVVIVDTPPGPSLYLQQALRAATLSLVVIHADAASYATIPSMENLLDRYCHSRSGFAGSAYILNAVSASSDLSRDIARVVRADLGNRVVPVVVHQDEAVREALACEKPVLAYSPGGEAARDIDHVVRWMDQQLNVAFGAAPQRTL